MDFESLGGVAVLLGGVAVLGLMRIHDATAPKTLVIFEGWDAGE
jgi:hypothetical protein